MYILQPSLDFLRKNCMEQTESDNESTEAKKSVKIIRHNELKPNAYHTVDAVIKFAESQKEKQKKNPCMGRAISTA
jgi:hypothetical protein